MSDADALEEELRTQLSPIEKAVLATCVEYRTRAEIQTDLQAEFSPDRVVTAIAYLKRKRLVEAWHDEDAGDRLTRELAYKQTIVGQLVLRAQRRAEARALLPSTPPRRLPSLPRKGLRVVR